MALAAGAIDQCFRGNEMTWTRMMDGMATPPRFARCKREYADYATNPVISWWAMAEERTVTAICWIIKGLEKLTPKGQRGIGGPSREL